MAELTGQLSMLDDDLEYTAFVDKFKTKKTTDDCYTPPMVYDAVAEWVAAEYGLDRARFVRPFQPGGDYERYPYEAGDVVVDNPPFSILAQIVAHYRRRGIPFFLFAPTLTLFTRRKDVCHIPIGVSITYDNGAVVNTSFLTSLEPDGLLLRGAPRLYEAVKAADEVERRKRTKELPKYSFPPEILTSAAAYQICKYVDFRVMADDCERIATLDAMKAAGKSGIFGGAYLLNSRSAAERQAAERRKANEWQLSEREKAVIARLDENEAAPAFGGWYFFGLQDESEEEPT